MSKDQLFGALDSLQDRKQDQRERVPAVLGQGDANKTVHVLGRPGMMWVRLYGDRNQAQPAVNQITAAVHGLPVYVSITTDRRTGRRSLEVIGLGENEILTAGGTRAFDPYLPEHHKTHEWSPISHGRDVVHVYPRALAFGLVYPTIPASMRCKVSPIGYGHVISPKVYLGGETKDFTADVPSSANKAVLVQISMKGSTNTLQYDKGAEFSWTGYTDPVPASAVPSLTVGCLPLDRIILYNGMTSITEANFLHDFRLPFQTIGGISEATDLLSDSMPLGYSIVSDGAGGCSWRRWIVVSDEEPADKFPGQLWINTSGDKIIETEEGEPLITEEGDFIGLG